MIYTSYFGRLKELEKDNIIPIAICGKVPEWYRGLRYPKLAPKYKFFMEWKENHDNEYYEKCYYEQVLNNLNPYETTVCELEELLPSSLKTYLLYVNCPIWECPDVNIALICYEPKEFCHRHLVSKWLNKEGIWCKEYVPSDSKKGMTFEQLCLFEENVKRVNGEN